MSQKTKKKCRQLPTRVKIHEKANFHKAKEVFKCAGDTFDTVGRILLQLDMKDDCTNYTEKVIMMHSRYLRYVIDIFVCRKSFCFTVQSNNLPQI